MAKKFNPEMAEREANKIGLEFAHSNDVVKDMSRAYNVDFSNIKVHTDSAADNKVKAAGKDALAQGNDVFFGKGIFESSDPAAKGLVAHEFAHTMQQGAAIGGEMAVAESAPMGMAQGGLRSWFSNRFGKGKRRRMRNLEDAMAEDVDVLKARYDEQDANPMFPYADYAKKRAQVKNFEDKTYTPIDEYYSGYNLPWSGDMVNTASSLMNIMGTSLKKDDGQYDLDEILDDQIKTINEEIKYDSGIDQEKYEHFLDAGRLLGRMPVLGELNESTREKLPDQIKSLYKQYELLRKSLKGE